MRRRVDEQTRLERQLLARQLARYVQPNPIDGLVARAAEDQLFRQQLEADRLDILRGWAPPDVDASSKLVENQQCSEGAIYTP